MPGKGIAVAAGTAGIILIWSGVENKSALETTRNLITGTKPAPGPSATPVTDTSGGTVTPSGNVASAGRDSQNQALGKILAEPYGWSTGAEWTALNNIVEAESGWSDTVTNASSGAAGIAQNINGFSADYQAGNATQQINWLLSYIQGRYGDPVAAWQFHLANGWY